MPSLPFLVTTRIIAGFIAVIPLYVLGLLTSYFATRTIATQAYGQSTGTYDHYFNLFLPPEDVLWSFLKVLVFAVVIILTHCYYGYRASGGPAGVGLAVGRAVRFSIVADQHHRPVPVAWPSGARRRPSGSRGEATDEQGQASSAAGCRASRSSSSWRCCSAWPWRIYNKAFTEVARVTLETDTAGNQLQDGLRRQGARRHRRRGPRGRRRRRRRHASSWRIDPEHLDADPGRRHRPAAAQDAVRRALRRPECRTSPRASGSPTATSSAQDRTRERHRAAAGHRRPAAAAAGGRAGGPLLHPRRGRRGAARPRRRSWAQNLAATGELLRGDQHRAARAAGRHLRPRRLRRHLRRRGRRPARRAGQPGVTNTTIVDQEEQLRRTFTVGDELGERPSPASSRPTSGT